MLTNLLKDNIFINTSPISWQQALNVCASNLIKTNAITPQYIESIIQNTNKTGFYFVIHPQIALAHSRPQDGVNTECLALLTSAKPIQFGQNTNVGLVFLFGSSNNTNHVEMLTKLASLLEEENTINSLIQASTPKQILTIINNKTG